MRICGKFSLFPPAVWDWDFLLRRGSEQYAKKEQTGHKKKEAQSFRKANQEKP